MKFRWFKIWTGVRLQVTSVSTVHTRNSQTIAYTIEKIMNFICGKSEEFNMNLFWSRLNIIFLEGTADDIKKMLKNKVMTNLE